MGSLVIFRQQVINGFMVPSFSLSPGEIVVIQLPGGAFFYPLRNALFDLLTGKTVNEHTVVSATLKDVVFHEQSMLGSRFYPATVDRYISRYAHPDYNVYKKVCDAKAITPKTKIKDLDAVVKRKLSLYTALSWSPYIVFDLAGLTPFAGKDIFRTVKAETLRGAAAILIDHCDEFKDDCKLLVAVHII